MKKSQPLYSAFALTYKPGQGTVSPLATPGQTVPPTRDKSAPRRPSRGIEGAARYPSPNPKPDPPRGGRCCQVMDSSVWRPRRGAHSRPVGFPRSLGPGTTGSRGSTASQCGPCGAKPGLRCRRRCAGVRHCVPPRSVALPRAMRRNRRGRCWWRVGPRCVGPTFTAGPHRRCSWGDTVTRSSLGFGSTNPNPNPDCRSSLGFGSTLLQKALTP